MRYVVVTAKHHDGFALYPSKVSTWDVEDATGWKRDPLRELADACGEAGLKLGIYYSLGRDWSHPQAVAKDRDNTWDFSAEGRDAQRYIDEKVVPQLTELLTGYGPVGVVWFDTPEQTTRKQSIALELLVRRLQPDAVVNTRVGNGVGDYDEMPDNRIPERSTGRDFEVPATMAESWGYSSLDTEPFWKSSTELIRQLVDVASKGGNYLLNVGPDGSGALPPLARRRLADIGAWMAVNGEAIHRTLASSMPQPSWGRFTQRGDTLYAHVFEWPRDLPLVLPVDQGYIRTIELLGPGGVRSLGFTASSGASVLVPLPPKPPSEHVSVLRIALR
jgi:alpha-L-fucosidase